MYIAQIVAAVTFALLLHPAWSIHVRNTSSVSQTANTPASTQGSSAGSDSTFTATSGTGSAYASACASAFSVYSSQDAVYSQNASIGTDTSYLGGTSYSMVKFYANATTLCDGHARVSASPAVPLTSSWTTFNNSATKTVLKPFTIISEPDSFKAPSCTINPDDCDPLWSSYSSALSAWSTLTAASGAPIITASPVTPPCMNKTAASSWSSQSKSMYGCGLCTIFGGDVQLLYFPVPTTVSRDFCATTPSASLTHYEPGAVLTAYAGNATMGTYNSNAKRDSNSSEDVAVVNGHTLQSGMAYISIRSVWAQDRCSSLIGTTVTDAILAMPSESVLSLRYSQNHFQYFASTDTQTGYPVSYADFREPVPWSAWNGQAICAPFGPGQGCEVIYAKQYRPQLAIPPGIKMLDPKWANCQMWYGGLYDPPRALVPTTLEAAGGIGPSTSQAASPSVAATPTTAANTATAMSENLPSTAASTAQPAQASTATPAQASQIPASTQASAAGANGNGQQEQGSSAQSGGATQAAGGQGTAAAGSPQATPGAQNSESGGSHSGSDSNGGGSNNAGSAVGGSGGSGSTAGGSSNAGSSAGGSNNAASSAGGSNNAGSSNAISAQQQRVFVANGQTYTATLTNDVVVVANTCTMTPGAPAQTISGASPPITATYQMQGQAHVLVVGCASEVAIGQPGSGSGAAATATSDAAGAVVGSGSARTGAGAGASAATSVITIVNQIVTVSQCSPSAALAIGSTTLLPGAAPVTLADGLVVSDVQGSLDWTWSSSITLDADAASSLGSTGGASATSLAAGARSSSGSSRASSMASTASRVSSANGVVPTQTSTSTSDASRSLLRLDVLITVLAYVLVAFYL